jgi:tripartite-type tricarboxylate transporter receptor subunit TctC
MLGGLSPNVVVVHPSLPVKNIKELIALAKARPGELNYGASAPGSTQHLSGELFKSMAGVDIVYVAFKGGGPSIIALMAGEVQLVITGTSSVDAHIKARRLRALAVASARPSALAPGLPTVAATGLPGYEVEGIDAVYAPAGTPNAIINRLNREMARAINEPEVKKKFLDSGIEPVGGSPETLGARLKSEIALWSKVIEKAGIGVPRR